MKSQRIIKFLSFLLAFVMVFSMIPTSIFAVIEKDPKKTKLDDDGGGGGGYVHNSNYDDHRFDQSATHQEWVEGQNHNDPQVGDVVIKADGTRVTLEATNINGTMILGWGANGPQGVDPYTGVVGVNGTYRVGSLSWWDSSPLVKDPSTGSVFSTKEWKTIRGNMTPTYDGKTEGEHGGYGNWFEWDGWAWIWDGPSLR